MGKATSTVTLNTKTMNKQSAEYYRGVFETLISLYKYHVRNIACGVQSVTALELGFKVELWYGDPSDCQFESLVILGNEHTPELEALVQRYLDTY